MSEVWEFISSAGKPVLAVESTYSWHDLLYQFVGLGSYTAAVFVLGYMTARARLTASLDAQTGLTAQETDPAKAAQACDRILAEIRQEIDTHSDSTRRLNEQLGSSDRDQICDQAKATRDENTEFQQFLDDRCSQFIQRRAAL